MITPLIVKHFAHWGLDVHVGSNGNNSKFEVLFCAKDQICYTNPTNYDGKNLSPIRWEGGFHIAVVDTFKYLGSCLTRNGRDYYDIDSRIVSARYAFGTLRKCIFSSCNILTLAKRSVCVLVIISIYPIIWI